MESTSAYIISIITALIFLLLSAIIANAIKFEGGTIQKTHRHVKPGFGYWPS
ncbi:hypothetical protein [Pedobacter sp. P26]|uniref:hypothetical protein n=1 Tax=Pedobacter sp. P26 TaxID=3423956 RepID=UPI003D6785D0